MNQLDKNQLDDHVLSLSTSGLFIALDADRLQPYLTFPPTLTEDEWCEWVMRVAPVHQADYLSRDAVEGDRDRRIFYDPQRQWYGAGRYIAGLAVLAAACDSFAATDPLSDLMVELDPASFDELEPAALAAWIGFWQILGYDGGDEVLPRPEQPFWITQAYDGDHAALTPPDRLMEIVTAMQEEQVLDAVLPGIRRAGLDGEDDLRQLLHFMQQTATSGQWLLGLEAAT